MNVLLINFETDPDSKVLAWQSKVAEAIAGRVDRLVVLTHRLGRWVAPDNAAVHVFPSIPLRAPARWVGGAWWLNLWVAQIARAERVDACFIHMNMEWGYRLAPTFRALGIPVLMWYAHGSVTRRLKLALRCVDRVVTSTPEGFRIASPKVRIIGQGIDLASFSPMPFSAVRDEIITVGRVSERKGIHLEIEALAQEPLRSSGLKLRIVGPSLTDQDREYLERCRMLAGRLGVGDRVLFRGAVSFDQLASEYANAFLHLNVSATGSMDKTVMESLAMGCPVLTSNEAFASILAPLPQLRLRERTPQTIAEQVWHLHNHRADLAPDRLRELVVGKHDLDSYADRVVGHLKELT